MERDNRTLLEIVSSSGTNGEKYAKITGAESDKVSTKGDTYHIFNIADGFSSTRLFLWSPTHNLSVGDIIKFEAEAVNNSFLSTKSIVKGTVSEDDAVNSVITEFNTDIKSFFDRVLSFSEFFVVDERFLAFIKFLLNESYFNQIKDYPAAKSVHHAVKGGILRHTYEMFDLYENMAKSEICANLHHEYMIIGILYHDFFKFKEYDLSTGSIKRTQESYLLGHIYLGANFISSCFKQFESATGVNFSAQEKAKTLHMILSHHGDLEWGSPVKPSTKEAQVLHYIDQISAKLNMFDSTGNMEENKFLGTAHIR